MGRAKYSVRIDEELRPCANYLAFYTHVYVHRWFGKFEVKTFFASSVNEARDKADRVIQNHRQRRLGRTRYVVRL